MLKRNNAYAQQYSAYEQQCSKLCRLTTKRSTGVSSRDAVSLAERSKQFLNKADSALERVLNEGNIARRGSV